MLTGTFRTSLLFAFLTVGVLDQIQAYAQERENSRLVEATFTVDFDNADKVKAFVEKVRNFKKVINESDLKLMEPVRLESLGVYIVTGKFNQQELDDLRAGGFEESDPIQVNLFEGASCDDPDPMVATPSRIVPQNVCRVAGSPPDDVGPVPSVWIIDSGIDVAAFREGLFNIAALYDCTQSPCTRIDKPKDHEKVQDNVGHGTMVAGIIGGKTVPDTAPFRGIKGVSPNAPLKIIKAFDSASTDLFGTPSLALQLVENQANPGDILNISWGARFPQSAQRPQQFRSLARLDRLLHAIADKQVRIVVAAGNGEGDLGPWAQTIFPANAAPYTSTVVIDNLQPAGGIYSVSATESLHRIGLPPECGTGAEPRWCDLFWRPGAFGATYSEPGVDVLSVWKSVNKKQKKKGLQQNTCSGTSFAAPLLAGMLVLGSMPSKAAIQNPLLADGTDALGYLGVGMPDNSSGLPLCN